MLSSGARHVWKRAQRGWGERKSAIFKDSAVHPGSQELRPHRLAALQSTLRSFSYLSPVYHTTARKLSFSELHLPPVADHENLEFKACFKN